MARVAASGPTIVHATAIKAMFRDYMGDTSYMPTFEEAIKDIEEANIIPEVDEYAEQTLEAAADRKKFGDLIEDPLSVDCVAAIMKYCAEDTQPQLYAELTSRCYTPDRRAIAPFKKFLWLMVKALEMLEPYSGKMVNRGVKEDLRSEYPVEREFVWHGPVSTTKSVGVLSNPMFLGTTGKRTVFQIELAAQQARDISRFSPLAEGEVLLPPGCKFRVQSVLPQGDLTIIQLQELPSKMWILDLKPKLPVGSGGNAVRALNAAQEEQVAKLAEELEEAQKQLHAQADLHSERLGEVKQQRALNENLIVRLTKKFEREHRFASEALLTCCFYRWMLEMMKYKHELAIEQYESLVGNSSNDRPVGLAASACAGAATWTLDLFEADADEAVPVLAVLSPKPNCTYDTLRNASGSPVAVRWQGSDGSWVDTTLKLSETLDADIRLRVEVVGGETWISSPPACKESRWVLLAR